MSQNSKDSADFFFFLSRTAYNDLLVFLFNHGFHHILETIFFNPCHTKRSQCAETSMKFGKQFFSTLQHFYLSSDIPRMIVLKRLYLDWKRKEP